MSRWVTAAIPLLTTLSLGCGEVLLPDAGLPDAGPAPDASAAPDSGPPPEDAGAPDAEPLADAEPADAAVPDAQPEDAGAADAGFVTLTVRLTGAGDGRVLGADFDCPSTCAASFAPGTRVTVTASVTEASSTFVGWSEPTCGSARQCTLTVSEDRELVAEVALRAHTVEVEVAGDGAGAVSSQPAGVACPPDCQEDWTHGTQVTLSARPDPGSVFRGWTPGVCPDALDPDCRLTVQAPLDVRAVFDPDLERLSVSISGAGAGRVRSMDGNIDCNSDGSGTCVHDYALSTPVRLTAEVGPASTFAGWSGACSGTGVCDVVMSSDRSVAATFEPVTYDVTVTRAGPGTGDVTEPMGRIDCGATCAATVPAGTQLTLTAAPAPNHRFVGWSGACAGPNPTCNLTVTANAQITALFELEPKLVAGFWHACATNRSGQLRCWGDNARGQLGYGTTQTVGDDETPRSMGDVNLGAGVVVEDIALGFEHTCAILSGGTVRCWGNGGSGRLGIGSTTDRGGTAATRPFLVPDVALPAPAVSVVAGFAHSCALLDTGEVYCWGSNQFGQLGVGGSTTDVGSSATNLPYLPNASQQPGFVPLGAPATQLVASGWSNCARLSTGDVRCWGDGRHGQLGYGNTTVIGIVDTPAGNLPVPLGGVAAEIYPATGAHYCARLTTNAVRCWGLGLEGRLGHGAETSIGDSSPVGGSAPLSVPSTPVRLEAGGAHTCAMFTPLDVRCWGRNQEAQLGYQDFTTRGHVSGSVPANLPSLDITTGVAAVVLGGYFTCLRYPNDDITCWGDNTRGQLGTGSSMQVIGGPGFRPATNPVISVF